MTFPPKLVRNGSSSAENWFEPKNEPVNHLKKSEFKKPDNVPQTYDQQTFTPDVQIELS